MSVFRTGYNVLLQFIAGIILKEYLHVCLSAPLAFEPFSTLAMIYEDDEDTEKALQFGLIAAHLNPSDSEEWIRLAEMSLQQDNIRQAILCYTKGQIAKLTVKLN